MTEEGANMELVKTLKDELSLLAIKVELKDSVLEEAYTLVDSLNKELWSYKGLNENLTSWSLSLALFASWRQSDPLNFEQMEKANVDVFQLLNVCRKLCNSFDGLGTYAEAVSAVSRTLSQETLIHRKLHDLLPRLLSASRKYRELDFLDGDTEQVYELIWVFLLYLKKVLKHRKLIDCSMETSTLYNLAIATVCILVLDKPKNEDRHKRQKIEQVEEPLCEIEISQIEDICYVAGAIKDDVIGFIRLASSLLPTGFVSLLPFNSLSEIDSLREILVREYDNINLGDNESISFDELQIFRRTRSPSEDARNGNSLHSEKELHVLASLASGTLSEGSPGRSSKLEELTKLSKFYFGETSLVDFSPVTCSLAATVWLREVTRKRPEVSYVRSQSYVEATSELRRFCEICGSNTYHNVIETASKIVSSFFETSEWYGNEFLEERREQVFALYFYILEKVLLAEEKRLHRQNFGNLLGNECLHRSLVACSIVTSLACYGCQDRYLFLSVLRFIDISPFEYTKASGSFITAVEDIPRSVQKFLVKIEKVAVECICWQDASFSSYLEKSLSEAQLLSSGDGNASNGPLDLYDNTVSESVPYSVLVFLRRLIRIASEKIREFCSRMEVSEIFEELVSITVSYALTRHFDLLVKRHVDVIVMCSLYAVSKITKEQLKFNDIAAFYRDIFQRKANHLYDIEENLSRVYLEGHCYGDIIEFYNRSFIKRFRSFLLEYLKTVFEERMKASSTGTEKVQNGPTTPVRSFYSKVGQSPSGSDSVYHSPSPSVRTSPSRKIGKVTISPMSPEGRRQMARRTPMTPKTKALYAFGESPGGHSTRSGKKPNYNDTGVSGIDENLQGAKPLSFNCGAFGRYNSLVPILITSDGRPPLPPQERSS